ncbi:hypothetical protein D3C85_1682530 [compost metagenome]
MKCCNWACMALKARIAWRISWGPSGSMGGARKSTPKRRAPSAKRCKGVARRRVAISATRAVEISTSRITIR